MTTTNFITPKQRSTLLWGLWTIAALIGVWGLFQRFFSGKDLAAYSSYVPWGLWVSQYIYFIGLSAGAYLFSSLVYLFRVKSLQPLGRPALLLAMITMILALGSIGLDLGRMERAYRVYWAPNFTSMMAWMIWMYSAYFVILSVGIYLAFKAPSSKAMQIVAGLGLPLAIAFNGGVGALFGVIGAQATWNSGLYPILFIAGALVSGCALLLFTSIATLGLHRTAQSPAIEILRKALIGLIILDSLFVWSDLSIGLYSSIPEHAEVFHSMLFGKYWYTFWIMHVGVAVLLPLFLLLKGQEKPSRLAWAGLLVVVGFFGVRLNMVIPDLVHSSLKGFIDAYSDSRLTFNYTPNFFEWSVFLGVVAAGCALYYVGFNWLKQYEVSPHEELPVDSFVEEKRGVLKTAAVIAGGAIAAWGIFRTRRQPGYAMSGASLPVPEKPQFPTSKTRVDVLYRMQSELIDSLKKPLAERKWGMVIDTRKCVGCHACTIACVAENKLPPGVLYRPVLTEVVGEFPNLSQRFVPRPCMQCEEPPCVPVCPVKATYKRPDGIVEINYKECIGCRYCITACPYNARSSDFGDYQTTDTPQLQPYETAANYEYGKEWTREDHSSPVGNARKCHFCLHRVERGLLPECVTTCIGRATLFGDLNNPESLVSELNLENNRMLLLEHLGTEPKVTYLT